MLKPILAGLALFAGAGAAGLRGAEQQGTASFSIVLEATPTGWSAECDTGCRWQAVSFECATVCGAVVDANGLVTLGTLRPEPTPFLFLVEHTRSGARAESRTGTAWKTVSWECPSLPCRARIDARGVGAATR
jgi:hypothetical protein